MRRTWRVRALALVAGLAVARLAVPLWCGRDAAAWFDGDAESQWRLASKLVAFEAADEDARAHDGTRFEGEWALVTHQMIALGLAQLCLAHPAWAPIFAPTATRAAAHSFEPDMRRFGTHAWGEDAMDNLDSNHGHAYLAYAALALGMARRVDPLFPPQLARQHDELIAAYVRRLAASPTGLIDTYPHEAYPTDVAAVAGAIAVHGLVAHVSHADVLRHWAERLSAVQIDPRTGLVFQRMDAITGEPHDAPRGSGTALAAYFAGFASREAATTLADGLERQLAVHLGFGAIREYADGRAGGGDIDSGPVVLGVSVSATGFALAPMHALGRRAAFEVLYRTVDLFGVPADGGFAIGGPIGNAILLAMLTSGPELPPEASSPSSPHPRTPPTPPVLGLDSTERT